MSIFFVWSWRELSFLKECSFGRFFPRRLLCLIRNHYVRNSLFGENLGRKESGGGDVHQASRAGKPAEAHCGCAFVGRGCSFSIGGLYGLGQGRRATRNPRSPGNLRNIDQGDVGSGYWRVPELQLGTGLSDHSVEADPSQS